SHPHRFLWASVASLQLGDETRARMLAARDVSSCRRDGAITDLAIALSRLAFAEVVEGRLPSARANAAEGFALATQAALENLACYHRALLAWIAALGGSSEDAQALAHEASEVGRAHDRSWQCAIGTIALGERALG